MHSSIVQSLKLLASGAGRFQDSLGGVGLLHDVALLP